MRSLSHGFLNIYYREIVFSILNTVFEVSKFKAFLESNLFAIEISHDRLYLVLLWTSMLSIQYKHRLERIN